MVNVSDSDFYYYIFNYILAIMIITQYTLHIDKLLTRLNVKLHPEFRIISQASQHSSELKGLCLVELCQSLDLFMGVGPIGSDLILQGLVSYVMLCHVI